MYGDVLERKIWLASTFYDDFEFFDALSQIKVKFESGLAGNLPLLLLDNGSSVICSELELQSDRLTTQLGYLTSILCFP